MKIVLLTESFWPERGGIQNYLEHVVDNLSTHNIKVIAPKTPNARKTKSSKYVVERRKFFSNLARPKWLWLFISLWRSAKKGEFNVLLCGKALFEGQVGYYLNKYLGIPYVIFTYGMEIETWKSQPKTKRQLARVLSAATRVTYMNNITKNSLHELGVHENQLVEILPGVDDRFFENIDIDTKQSVLGKYHLKTPYILCVSRLIKRKGIDTLIEAFARLDQTKFENWKLVIVGTGPESVRLLEEAEQNLVAPAVKFLGDVPDKDLPALYAGADIFVLTPQPTANDIEGFGIVYLEAAAASIPSLATNIGGISEAVVSGETGLLVEPDSIEAICNGLAELLDNENKRKAFGKNAHLRADHSFRWIKRIQFVETMLNDIVDSVKNRV